MIIDTTSTLKKNPFPFLHRVLLLLSTFFGISCIELSSNNTLVVADQFQSRRLHNCICRKAATFISTTRNGALSQNIHDQVLLYPSFLPRRIDDEQVVLMLSSGFGGSVSKKTEKKKKKKKKRSSITANNNVNPVLRNIVNLSEASTKLDSDALALLEETKGDLNLARTNFLGYSLAYLKEAMPDLYEQIKDVKTTTASREVHHALLELTWDAVAAYIPVMTKSGKPEGDILAKLESIAKSSSKAASNIHGDDDGKNWKVLDVGCGNGILLPYLRKQQQSENIASLHYFGCDLSPRMIELAQKDYVTDNYDSRSSTIRFEQISFETIVGENDNKNDDYDAIIFNGSLQFFSDVEETLRMAKFLLVKDDNNIDGHGKKIIIAHVNGASFVRKERIENPATVLSTMPTVQELQTISQKLEMELEFPFEKKSERFYLAVLRLP